MRERLIKTEDYCPACDPDPDMVEPHHWAQCTCHLPGPVESAGELSDWAPWLDDEYLDAIEKVCDDSLGRT